MRRREFIAVLGGATVAWRRPVYAQRVVPVVGYISAAGQDDYSELVDAFRQGLRDSHYVEGQNVAVEYRWAEGRYDRLPSLARELVDQNVTVIAATSTPVALAAKEVTTVTPIVFTVGGDPVQIGLVSNLSRPDGNLTGVTRYNVELGPKRLELLHEVVPDASPVALLVNPNNPNTDRFTGDLRRAASALRIEIEVLRAALETEIGAAFEVLDKLHIHALVIANDPFFNSRSEQLAALTVRHGIAAIYQYRKFVESGGLLSYSASNTQSHRELGMYVGRILAGARPVDLPVEQSTKVELIVNLNTAKALGLTVPQSLLARADEVIE
jgi:putative ABC transport system substrate-binding protein